MATRKHPIALPRVPPHPGARLATAQGARRSIDTHPIGCPGNAP